MQRCNWDLWHWCISSILEPPSLRGVAGASVAQMHWPAAALAPGQVWEQRDAGSRSAGRTWGAWKLVPLARCITENRSQEGASLLPSASSQGSSSAPPRESLAEPAGKEEILLSRTFEIWLDPAFESMRRVSLEFNDIVILRKIVWKCCGKLIFLPAF